MRNLVLIGGFKMAFLFGAMFACSFNHTFNELLPKRHAVCQPDF